MTRHAAAMVAWKTFRQGSTGGQTVFDYGSNQARLLELVGDGGTLWLVTSTRRRPEPRQYHLAYKLTDCAPIDPTHSIHSERTMTTSSGQATSARPVTSPSTTRPARSGG